MRMGGGGGLARRGRRRRARMHQLLDQVNEIGIWPCLGLTLFRSVLDAL